MLLTLSVLLGLSLLTACTAPASTSGASPSTGAQAAPLSADSELAVGILKLENTAQAVDAKEAAELLPLWQLLSELKSSSSSAQQEVNAVVEDIQATITDEQLSAIDEMALSQTDLATVLQGAASATSASVSSTSSSQERRAQAGGGMVMIAGGPPPGGAGDMVLDSAMGGGPGTSTSSNQSTSSAASQGSSAMGSTVLIDQVIKLLQAKIQG